MNKPLSRLRRAEIERDLADQHVSYNDFAGEAIRDLLASESFWREAVKNAPPCDDEGCCIFCDAYGMITGMDHKPDCVWLLAQES